MDRMYRRQRHIYDASRKFYLLGRDDLIRELQPPSGGSILEIGCGTARNLVLAARAYPDAKLYGFDVSAQMLASARVSIAREGLAGRIRVARADAADLSSAPEFGVEKFDRVFVSYALSMIPAWRQALDNAADRVAPNGSLHIVDFGDFGQMPNWFGRLMSTWLAAFDVTPRHDFEDAIAALAARRGMRAQCVTRFRGYATHAVVVAPGRQRGGAIHERGDATGVVDTDLRRAALAALNISRDNCRQFGALHTMRESARHFIANVSEAVGLKARGETVQTAG